MRLFALFFVALFVGAALAEIKASDIPLNKVTALLRTKAKGLEEIQAKMYEIAATDCGDPAGYQCQLKAAILASPAYNPPVKK